MNRRGRSDPSRAGLRRELIHLLQAGPQGLARLLSFPGGGGGWFKPFGLSLENPRY